MEDGQEMNIHEAAEVFSGLLDDNGNLAEAPEKGESDAGGDAKPAKQAKAEKTAEDDDAESEEAEDDGKEEEGGEDADESEDEEGEEEDGEEKDEADEPKKFTVKVDGKTIEVDEKELVEGYQRTADYTRKTQQLAAREREVTQAAEQAVREADTKYTQIIENLMELLGDEFARDSKVDVDKLIEEDPVEYMKYQARQQKRAEALAEHQAQQRMAAERQTRETMQRESQAVLEKIPEWGDSKVASAERAEVGKYLQSTGFSVEELNGLMDHRQVLVARKAMLYDKLMQSKPEVKQKLDKTPVKVSKSGSRTAMQPNSNKALEQRLAKTGKVEDAAALFKSYVS